MDEYQAKMKLTETNFKKVIDTRINPVMEKLNVAKAKFEKSEKYCSELTTSIKAMSGKFDDIKNGMESMEKSKKEQEQQIETLSMQ
jgi:F0F1-type ATP synthase membrane subunit b/b'